MTICKNLITSQLVWLQLQGGMLGPMHIVLIGSLNSHLHITAFAKNTNIQKY